MFITVIVVGFFICFVCQSQFWAAAAAAMSAMASKAAASTVTTAASNVATTAAASAAASNMTQTVNATKSNPSGMVDKVKGMADNLSKKATEHAPGGTPGKEGIKDLGAGVPDAQLPVGSKEELKSKKSTPSKSKTVESSEPQQSDDEPQQSDDDFFREMQELAAGDGPETTYSKTRLAKKLAKNDEKGKSFGDQFWDSVTDKELWKDAFFDQPDEEGRRKLKFKAWVKGKNFSAEFGDDGELERRAQINKEQRGVAREIAREERGDKRWLDRNEQGRIWDKEDEKRHIAQRRDQTLFGLTGKVTGQLQQEWQEWNKTNPNDQIDNLPDYISEIEMRNQQSIKDRNYLYRIQNNGPFMAAEYLKKTRAWEDQQLMAEAKAQRVQMEKDEARASNYAESIGDKEYGKLRKTATDARDTLMRNEQPQNRDTLDAVYKEAQAKLNERTKTLLQEASQQQPPHTTAELFAPGTGNVPRYGKDGKTIIGYNRLDSNGVLQYEKMDPEDDTLIEGTTRTDPDGSSFKVVGGKWKEWTNPHTEARQKHQNAAITKAASMTVTEITGEKPNQIQITRPATYEEKEQQIQDEMKLFDKFNPAPNQGDKQKAPQQNWFEKMWGKLKSYDIKNMTPERATEVAQELMLKFPDRDSTPPEVEEMLDALRAKIEEGMNAAKQ